MRAAWAKLQGQFDAAPAPTLFLPFTSLAPLPQDLHLTPTARDAEADKTGIGIDNERKIIMLIKDAGCDIQADDTKRRKMQR